MLWDQLQAEPGSDAFFNLLSLLPGTEDFNVGRASLTHRVWTVVEAASGNAQLREILFGMARTPATCMDGRILTFSQLEIKVHVLRALEGVDATDLARRGAALLKLSRQMFRLEQVDALAEKDPSLGHDPAETFLQFRISFKHRLDLPGVPQSMRYRTLIHGRVLETAALAVLELSRLETGEPVPAAPDPQQPGPSRDLMGETHQPPSE